MDAGYKKRLTDWLTEEISQVGGQRELSRRMGVSLGAIQHWLDGKYRASLSLESIERIAAYRGMSRFAVTKWLHDDPEMVIDQEVPAWARDWMKSVDARLTAIEERLDRAI